MGFTCLNRVLPAQWAYYIAVIPTLLWPLLDTRTDGLLNFTGPNRVLAVLAFGLTSFGKLDTGNLDNVRLVTRP